MNVWNTSSIDASTNTVVSYGIRHSTSRGKLAASSVIFARASSAVASALAPGRR